MTTTTDYEQPWSGWLAEQHRRAQAHAAEWADHATHAQQLAEAHRETVRAGEGMAGAPHDRLLDAERALAEQHAAASTAAQGLATMWARVATALRPPPA